MKMRPATVASSAVVPGNTHMNDPPRTRPAVPRGAIAAASVWPTKPTQSSPIA